MNHAFRLQKYKPNQSQFQTGSQKIQVFALTGVHRQAKALHPLIAWSATTFRNRPADIIEGTLSLARLAVQTV